MDKRIEKISNSVVLFPSTTEIAGVSVNVSNLALLLNKLNILNLVLCPKHGWLEENLLKHKIPLTILNISYKPRYAFFSSIKVFHFLRTHRNIKVVHLNGRFPILISLLSMIFLKRIRFVATIREFANTRDSGILGWKTKIETLILKRYCFRVAVVSKALKEEIIKRMGDEYKNKVMVIRNWIYPMHKKNKLSEYKPCEFSDKNIRMVGIGRLSFEKGFDVLISAVKLLLDKGYKINCDIYGAGPLKSALLKQVHSLELDNNVCFCGVVDNSRDILPNYNMVVIPSRKETFGMVALEAYDVGIPVIASNIPGLNETVIDGKTGLLFEVENPESLAAQVIRLSNDPDTCKFLTLNGKKYLEEFIPSQELIKKYLSFYGFDNDYNTYDI